MYPVPGIPCDHLKPQADDTIIFDGPMCLIEPAASGDSLTEWYSSDTLQLIG